MKRLTGFILAIVVAGCSSLKVTSDVDKNVDFSKYKTFLYYGWAKDSDKLLSDLNKRRFEQAFGEEFKSRGWELVQSDGDAIVSLFVVVDQKTSYTSYTDHYGYGAYGGMYGPRYGYYGMPMGSTTRTVEEDYLEGTLIVDVFDTKTKQQIWQGVATKTLNPDNKDKEAAINQAVAAIMAKFPVKKLSSK